MNDYLAASLVVSPIDKWFVGPGPRIARASLGVPDENADINAALAKARDALKRWDQTVQEVRPFSPSLPSAYPSARPSVSADDADAGRWASRGPGRAS